MNPAAAGCGAGGLDRARMHAERAVAELKAACRAWGCWADDVRQRAEGRLGVTGLADQRVLEDPEYGRALDMGASYFAAVNAAEAVLNAGCRGGAGGTDPARLPGLPGRHK